LEAHCIKGVGREHAKWSPVATAWYRLHPEVVLSRRVAGEEAAALVEAADAVFEVVQVGLGVWCGGGALWGGSWDATSTRVGRRVSKEGRAA